MEAFETDDPNDFNDLEAVSFAAPTKTKISKKKSMYIVGGTLCALLVGLAAYGGSSLFSRRPSEIIIPTLDLVQADVDSSNPSALTATVVGTFRGIPVNLFTAAEALQGFDAPKDEHVVFTCPTNTTPSLPFEVAAGDPGKFLRNRYWAYEYSGNEGQNEVDGKQGRDLFDGAFVLSQGELNVTGDEYGHLNTPGLIASAGNMYYLMIDGVTNGNDPFYVNCIDSDADNWNDAADPDDADMDVDDDGVMDGTELYDGTDPENTDSDNDGIQDGTEQSLIEGIDGHTDTAVFVADLDPATATSPTDNDTDDGGATDGQEDLNGNGQRDIDEEILEKLAG